MTTTLRRNDLVRGNEPAAEPSFATTNRLFPALDNPRQAMSNITPNWFAAVMGTAIIAVASASLPVRLFGLHAVGLVAWVGASLLLLVVSAATVAHWRLFPRTAARHHLHPVMAHFYGAPPMALLSVGAATMLVGRDLIGTSAAVAVDWVLWFAGTLTGLLSAVIVPYLQFTRHDNVEPRSPFGGWLMPVVPPMVSAATGALLAPYAPPGQCRLTLITCCYAMFGMSLIASIVVITLVWHRLAVHGVGPARMVPTLWIVLGVLGQSITAANLLGGAAAHVLAQPFSTALRAFGVVYGLPVWGFAVLWGAIAVAITVRTARAHLPFSLTWWSFTFPVGTCVTGTSALARQTGSVLFQWAAAALFASLLLAWATVAVRTARGVVRGNLLAPTP